VKWRKSAPTQIDPTLHLEALQFAETSKYEESGRNLFETVATAVTPDLIRREFKFPESPHIPEAVIPFSTGLRFFGFSSTANRKRVFLMKGEDLFIAKEGETIDRRYRVTHVMRDSVEVEDILAGVKERIFLSTF